MKNINHPSHNKSLNIFYFLGIYTFSCLSLAVVPAEKKIMDDARAAFEKGNMNQAIELYQKIPQTSDFWIEALEEKTWAHLRKGDNSAALSVITPLTSDLLAPQLGPEPYFLKAITNYKLCNIKGILEDFDLFKKRYKSRGQEIEKLANTGSNQATSKALEVLKAKKASLHQLKADDFGSDIQYLPRFFYRDRVIMSAASAGNDALILNRLSQLATDETKDIDDILQKMHLLESQVVQQVFAYNKEMHKKRNAQFSKIEDKNNTLVFPYSSTKGEMWLDEVPSFEAATSECPVDPFKGGQ